MSRRPERKRASRARTGAARLAAVLSSAEPPERLEVRAPADGIVPVPRLIVRLFDLVPGDLIVLEPEPGGVSVTPYRELMRPWLDRSAEEVVRSLDRLWPQEGGIFAPGRLLDLLPDAFPVETGQVLVWEVEDQGREVGLSLRRNGPPPGAPKRGQEPGRHLPPAKAGATAQRSSQRSQPPQAGPARPRPRASSGGRP